MRILREFPDWRDQYVADVHTARDELAENNFIADPKTLIMEIYSLPADHHQTFFVQMAFEHGLYRIFSAKALQRSVWFSDPLYGYTFVEALSFKDDPKRKGQILCGTKIVRRDAAERLCGMVERISESQPECAVRPDNNSDFNSIRVFDNGELRGEYLFTDASLLRLSTAYDRDETVKYLNDLHLKVEDIIGKGYSDPS